MDDLIGAKIWPYPDNDVPALSQHLAWEIWGQRLSGESQECAMYWEFYCDCLEKIDPAYLDAPQSHRDVLDLVKTLRRNETKILDDLVSEHVTGTESQSWPSSQSAEKIEAAFKLCAQIWTMCHTKTWAGTERLQDFLTKMLDSNIEASFVAPAVPRLSFDIQSLRRISGLAIIPTFDLQKHLLYDSAEDQLFVFSHPSFLRVADRGRNIAYPRDALKEAAQTMAFFASEQNVRKSRWYQFFHQDHDSGLELGFAPRLVRDPRLYKYWGQRLLVIQYLLDSWRPKPWLYDRRDRDRFFTFWFAIAAIILTLLFGLVQSVTGIVQAIKG